MTAIADAHPRPARAPRRSQAVIGWRETVQLPDILPLPFTGKIDSGARSSALHASRIRLLREDGADLVEFTPPRLPGAGRPGPIRLPVHDERDVTNTGGVPEGRVFVRTRLRLGRRTWRIELALTDRRGMTHELILGRTAVRGRGLLLDCGRSFLMTPPPEDTR
ncbi:MAG: ATP-dependent zinc protease family protein [Hasllibacter sp.]